MESGIRVGQAGVSERLREFINEMPYERGPIFEFVRGAADRLPPGSDVADLGAGDAPYRELFEHTNYVTIDWEKSLHDQAVESDIIASADAIPVAAASFDAVLLTQVLEHVPDPSVVLAELSRIIRPNGLLFLTAPLVWELHESPFDFYRFTEHGLEHLLRKAHFEDIEVIARNDCFTTLAQLMHNVSWMIESERDGNHRGEAAEALRRLAEELAALAPLDDARRFLPLGYAVTARRP
jgi:SAM-dependent methyltransferase